MKTKTEPDDVSSTNSHAPSHKELKSKLIPHNFIHFKNRNSHSIKDIHQTQNNNEIMASARQSVKDRKDTKQGRKDSKEGKNSKQGSNSQEMNLRNLTRKDHNERNLQCTQKRNSSALRTITRKLIDNNSSRSSNCSSHPFQLSLRRASKQNYIYAYADPTTTPARKPMPRRKCFVTSRSRYLQEYKFKMEQPAAVSSLADQQFKRINRYRLGNIQYQRYRRQDSTMYQRVRADAQAKMRVMCQNNKYYQENEYFRLSKLKILCDAMIHKKKDDVYSTGRRTNCIWTYSTVITEEKEDISSASSMSSSQREFSQMKLDFFSSQSYRCTRRKPTFKHKQPQPHPSKTTMSKANTANNLNGAHQQLPSNKLQHMLKKVDKEKFAINTLKERMKIFQYYANKVNESMQKRGNIVGNLIQEDCTDD